MNGDGRFFMTLEARDKTRLRLAAILAAGAAVSACANIQPFQPPTDPHSPAAKRVAELERANRTYPRWSRFPAAPKNVPTATDIAARVGEAQNAQAQLLADAGRIDWTLSGTEAYAEEARSHIDPTLAQPAPADTSAQTAAFAKALKDLATPPPPAK
jgi:hypothetical protein